MPKTDNKCVNCDKTTKNNKYCSRDCANKHQASSKNLQLKLSIPENPTKEQLDRFTSTNLINTIDQAVTDFKARISRPYAERPDEIIKLQPRSKPKTLAYGTKSFLAPTNGWSKPFHDLSEIARAQETESYLARSIQKHREYALKEGWFLAGKNPETIEYIRSRLLEFDLISDYSTEEWVRDGVTNLITYHNFFLVLAREPSKTTGARIRLHGKEIEPISGIFPMDPTSVEVSQNQAGRPTRWRQKIDGKEAKFDANDVIHGTMDRKTGFVFGTPYAIPVLDDIRALRRLEELCELVAHKHLFPLFHYTVGTDEKPADTIETADGTLIDEVDIVRESIEEMPTEGGIVTSERHKIELIGAQDKILDLQPYIQHFEARVMGGLRLSGVDLGRSETSNKACYTADTEVLTDRGWILHSDWTSADKIAVFDPNTEEIYHTEEIELHSYEVDEEIIKFSSEAQDIAVTTEHTMLYKTPNNPWQIKKAHEIEDHKRIIVKTSSEKWNGDESDLSDDYLKFVGICISEGGLNSRDFDKRGYLHMTLAQSYRVNNEKVIEIKRILNSLNIKNSEYNDEKLGCTRWNVYGEILRPLFSSIGRYSSSKKIPRVLLNLNKTKLQALFDGLMLGDGSWDTREGRTSGYYCTVSKELADNMQELAFKLGYGTKMSIHYEANGNRQILYRVILRKNNERTISRIEREQYKGKVYCFKTPTGFYVTRRNGCVSIQGNTAGVINKNLMDAVKDYQQVFSCIITKKLFNILLLEGGFDLNSENMVHFRFPPIDREELRAQQAHGLLMFTANTITIDEYRQDYLGLDPLGDEEMRRTSHALFVEPLAKLKAASKTTDAKAVSTVVLPENQHGKAPKPSIPKNDMFVSEITLAWNKLKTKLLRSKKTDNYDKVFKNDFIPEAKSIFNRYIEDAYSDGAELAKSFNLLNNDKISVKTFKVTNELLYNFIDNVIINLRSRTYGSADTATVLDTALIELQVIVKKYYDAAVINSQFELFKQNNYRQIKISCYNENYTVTLDGYTSNDVLLGIGSKIELLND